jgi:hypothetical protein
MNKLLMIPLFFILYCDINNTKVKPTLEIFFREDSNDPKLELIKLNENCKNTIETQIQIEYKKNYECYSCWKNKNNDTMIALFYNFASKEEKNNTIWIYLDQKCNILEKHVATFKRRLDE